MTASTTEVAPPVPATITTRRMSELHRLGRAFALDYKDPRGGLLMHPLDAGHQILTKLIFFDAGRISGRLSLTDVEHHHLLQGVSDGLRQRLAS